MSRITTLLTALFVLLLGATSRLAAQCAGSSCTENWTATVTVQATLSCAATQHFNFGSHPSSVGLVEVNELTAGRIVCTTDPGNHLNVSFTLPASLRDGLGHTVPLTYGSQSARLYDAPGSSGPVSEFNPATGFTGFLVNSGSASLTLGENGPNDPAFGVFVNLAGAAAGTYTGVITATIALQ